MMNGVHCQVSTTISESSAVRGRVSHSTGSSPRLRSSEFTTPNCASSMNRQNSPTTTGESIIGSRNSVASAPRPRTRREIRKAMRKPRAVWRMIAPATNSAVVTARWCTSGLVSSSA